MLIPNNKQKTKLFQCCGVGRFAYNWALGKQQENYKNGGKFISDNDLTLGEYKTCVNGNGVPWCIIHLKKQNISFYHIHALEIDIDIFPEDYREMITDDF